MISVVRLKFVGLALLSSLLLAPGWASERYKPGSTSRGSRGEFSTTAASGKANGAYTIGKSGISVELKGLRPNGVYSVSLVKVRPYASRGVPPVKFVADASGNAAVSLKVAQSSTKGWQLLLVNYLPKGDPKDTRSAKPILRTKL